MDKAIFEHLLKKVDPNGKQEVDFSLSAIPPDINLVLDWYNVVDELITEVALRDIQLSVKQNHDLHELIFFLKTTLDEHLKVELGLKVRSSQEIKRKT